MITPKAILLSVALIASSTAFAGAGAPVKHNHNGRTHTHPLPATGVNHNHNKGGNKATQRKPSPAKWVYLAGSGKGKNEVNHYAKAGSLRVANGKATIIGKVDYKNDNTVSVYKWSVPLSHCRNEAGQMSHYKISGKYLFASDFAFGAGNVGSTKARIICGAAIARR